MIVIKVAVVAACLVAFVRCESAKSKTHRETTKLNEAKTSEAPYIVAIYDWPSDMENSCLCYGNIIEKYWIITSANCIVSSSNRKTFGDRIISVKAGMRVINANESNNERTAVVDRIFVHDDYNKTGNLNDIALMRLKEPFDLDDRVDSIALPSNNENNNETLEVDDNSGTIFSWGSTSDNLCWLSRNPNDHVVLRTIDLPIVNRDNCNDVSRKFWIKYNMTSDYDKVHDTNLCTEQIFGDGTICEHEYGGPLVIKKNNDDKTRLVGIVSWSLLSCANNGSITVYTDVGSYVDWIVDVIKNNEKSTKSTIDDDKDPKFDKRTKIDDDVFSIIGRYGNGIMPADEYLEDDDY